MRTFIQLKDGIGWASVNTSGEVEGAIEVENGTGDSYIHKAYSEGQWSDAELTRYAEVAEDGTIIEIKRTYFPSNVDGPIMEPTTSGSDKWVDGSWVPAE